MYAFEKGREAFESGKGENDCPVNLTKTQRHAWVSGYREAKRQEMDSIQKEKEFIKWNAFSSSCPWHNSGKCLVLKERKNNSCSKDNCAPYYFKENFYD